MPQDSTNYGESLFNESELKKITTPLGTVIYFSEQALCYSIYTQGSQDDGWNWRLSEVMRTAKGTAAEESEEESAETAESVDVKGSDEKATDNDKKISDVGKEKQQDKKGVLQRISTIIESEEVDLFGTLITDISIRRDKVAHVLPAVSLGYFKGSPDTELIVNLGLARRKGENANMASKEKCLKMPYKYSFIVDLENVGKGVYALKKALSKIKDAKEDISKKLKSNDNKKNILKGFLEAYDKAIGKGLVFKDGLNDDSIEIYCNKVESIQYNESGETVKVELTKKERARRVCAFLDIVYHLGRKGRDMSPVFSVAGDVRYPYTYFENKVFAKTVNSMWQINLNGVNSDNALIGFNGLGDFDINNNNQETCSIDDLCRNLQIKACEFYGVKLDELSS